MKKLSKFFIFLSLILSHSMCAVVVYKYSEHICGMRHIGWSAPPDIAFIYAIPFLIGIIVGLVLARYFSKKGQLEHFKITSEMLNTPIPEAKRRKARQRTQLLKHLGITIEYDQPEYVYIEEYIPSNYTTIEEYEADKFNAQRLVYSDKPIPKDLEQRLVAARTELEAVGVLE